MGIVCADVSGIENKYDTYFLYLDSTSNAPYNKIVRESFMDISRIIGPCCVFAVLERFENKWSDEHIKDHRNLPIGKIGKGNIVITTKYPGDL